MYKKGKAAQRALPWFKPFLKMGSGLFCPGDVLSRLLLLASKSPCSLM